MSVWSFYSTSTGLFTGRRFSGPRDEVGANTPHSAAAIEGSYDHLSQRVDLATGAVIDYQPTPPDADHEWDTGTKRWRKRLDVLQREHRAAVARASIADAETRQSRAVREALLALLPDGPEKQRLADIDAEISARRTDLNR